MKWMIAYKIYTVSEDGLLKPVKDRWSQYGSMFDEWYYSQAEAIADINNKTNIHGIDFIPDQLHIIPVMVKVLE